MRRPWVAALAPLLLAGAGCYQPVDQPQVTRMIRISGGTFDIGGGNAALRCDGKDRPQRCDAMEKTPAVDYSNSDRTSHEVRNMASNVAEWVRDDWSLYGYCAKAAGYDYKCQLDGTRCQTCIDDEKIAKGTCAQSCAPLSLVLCTSGGTYKPVLTGDQTNAGVVRGGDFRHDKCFHRLYVRRKGNGAQPHVGFRCARAVRKP